MFVARILRIGLGAFLLIALMSQTSLTNAWAQGAEPSPRERAIAHHRRGLELFEQGDDREAIEAFSQAQRLSPAPSNLYNISMCRERLGDFQGAIAALEAYLEGDLSQERRRHGESVLQRLRTRQVGRLEISTYPPGAEVLIDGRPRGDQQQRTPMSCPVSPGDHIVEVRLDGHVPLRREITVTAAGSSVLSFVFQTRRSEQTVVEETPSRRRERRARREREEIPHHGTGAVGMLLAGNLALSDQWPETTIPIGLEIGYGLNVGRSRREGPMTIWPVTLEITIGLAGAFGVTSDVNFFTLHAGGRASVALGRFVRLELGMAVAFGLAGYDADDLAEYLGQDERSGFVDSGIDDDSRRDKSLVLIPSLAFVLRLGLLEFALPRVNLEFWGVSGDFPATDRAIRMSIGVDTRLRW